MLRWVVLFLGLLIFPPAQAANSEEYQKQLQDIQQVLASSTTKVDAIQKAMIASMRAQHDIAFKLTALNKEIAKRRGVIAAANTKLEPLVAEEKLLSENYIIKRDQLRRTTSQLLRARKVQDRKLAAGILSRLFQKQQKQKALAKEALSKLQATREAVQKKQEGLDKAFYIMRQDEETLLLLQHQKKAFAAVASKEFATQAKLKIDLTRKAKTIDGLMKALAAPGLPTPAVELQDKISFVDQTRTLELPAQGLISARFGEGMGLGAAFEGLGIATASLAPVISPIRARVEFAGEFRSYGNLIILSPGEGYLVLLAGMAQISTSQGQEVWPGEPIGLMGEKASSTLLFRKKTRSNRPNLYVEFRKDNKAIDSTPWWLNGLKEAVDDTRH